MINILIVEDDPTLSGMVSEYVQDYGYNVVAVCNNGHDAIKTVFEHPVDLILMDVRIDGDLDGIETATKIKDLFTVSLIYITGQYDDNLLKRASLTEPNAYLVKPFKQEDIKSNIEMAILKHTNEQNNKMRSVYNSEVEYNIFLKELGRILKVLRKDKGLSQVEFSKELGINYRHYQDLEGGKSNLKMETLFNLAKFYNLSVPKLFEKGLA
ncbi:MAG: response regulator [Bacteriovoracaceae bacterium]|jgi:two-component system, response regulator PdtaR|nr:response regulator [Bacteriovoracaceae bacterium]